VEKYRDEHGGKAKETLNPDHLMQATACQLQMDSEA
jgi:hypothetical protein